MKNNSPLNFTNAVAQVEREEPVELWVQEGLEDVGEEADEEAQDDREVVVEEVAKDGLEEQEHNGRYNTAAID